MSQETKTITKEEVEHAMTVMETQFQPQHQEVAQNLIEGFIQSEEFKKQALESGVPEEVIISMQLLAMEGASDFVNEILEEQEPSMEGMQEFLSRMEEDEDDFSEN